MSININQLKVVSRMIKSQEGRDFVELVLKPLQNENYSNLLDSGKTIRDELIGYGGCLQYLVRLCDECDSKITMMETKPPEQWS